MAEFNEILNAGPVVQLILKLKNPGIISMGLAFLIGIVVSLMGKEQTAQDKFEDEKLREYVGIGAE